MFTSFFGLTCLNKNISLCRVSFSSSVRAALSLKSDLKKMTSIHLCCIENENCNFTRYLTPKPLLLAYFDCKKAVLLGLSKNMYV